ncbi:MAG: SCO family protein [Bacteroidota bacterium]
MISSLRIALLSAPRLPKHEAVPGWCHQFQKSGRQDTDFLHLLSLSIDPERDSVERLKMWADRFQVNPDQWWLLTGPKKEIYDMAIQEMKIPVQDGDGIDTSFFTYRSFCIDRYQPLCPRLLSRP